MNAGVVLFIISLLALSFPALPRAEAETAAGTAYQAAERGWRQGGRYRATDGGRRVLGAAGAADDRP